MNTTKYNPTTRAKVLMVISQGRTVKDVCSFVGISDMTLARWRRRYPDFDEEYLKAVESQWQCLDAIKKSGARTYRRNSVKLRQKAEKLLSGMIRPVKRKPQIQKKKTHNT